jgi:hypothetical protein
LAKNRRLLAKSRRRLLTKNRRLLAKSSRRLLTKTRRLFSKTGSCWPIPGANDDLEKYYPQVGDVDPGKG